MQRLAEAADTVPAVELERLEQVHGWQHNPFHLTLDVELSFGVASGIMYDWVHLYLCDGLT